MGRVFVVLAILVSACFAFWQAVEHLLHPEELTYLQSPALIADGHHARVDGLVSLGVVLIALVVALGAQIADPIIGLAITLVILRVTWQSWRTVRGHGG